VQNDQICALHLARLCAAVDVQNGGSARVPRDLRLSLSVTLLIGIA
jgi:hypothetical protein